jgi:Golgi phosphoprotein 3 (GPP34)
VPGLSGTGRVADDLYLMAHHEISGKPYVQSRALSLGLAGGLLAELMLAGQIGLWHEEGLRGAACRRLAACRVPGRARWPCWPV